jgi:penicillin-binding protein 2
VVGRTGVELQYNSVLMGKNGSRRVVVDSRGREINPDKPLDEKPAVAGHDLKLTIDVDLQIAAEQALEGKNGAIVAMDPKTGEILAMVSRPTFDPNDFSVRISRAEWNQLINDPDKPLMNKAIQAQLAPGSTFKIIMATAGLQENIAQDLHVNCGGGAEFYGRYFKCWISARHQSHGPVDITKGIYQSCDVFFYTLAEKLGIGKIAKYASALGMGQKSGIDLPQEVSGVMPSEEWKLRNFRQKWFAGETISVGIGQGAIAATPIQMARAIGAIASSGHLVRPHVTNPTDLPPNVIPATNVPDEVTIPIDPANWEIITDAMAQVVSPVGTAALSAIKGVDFAGKTGSAQTVSNMLKAKMSAAEKARYKDNGWFVGVEPRRNPEIVVCALFQEGEHGSEAARVASQVIKAYVDIKQKRQPTKVAESEKKVEIGAVWTGTNPDDSGQQKLQAGHFVLDVPKRQLPLAVAAPGLGGVN